MKKETKGLGRLLFMEWLIPVFDYFRSLRKNEAVFEIIVPTIAAAGASWVYFAIDKEIVALDALAEIKESATTPHDIKTVDGFIRNVNQQLSDVELRLQDLWGFDRDPNKHTWWLKPEHCRCPKLDNTDPAFFGGGRIINSECPIHNLTKV